MNISIFGYKLNLEILILIGVIYLILVGHTVCGCSNYGLLEGLDVMTKQSTDPSGVSMPTVPSPSEISTNAKNGGSKMNGKVTESFVGANTNFGQSSPYDLATQTVLNTSSWSAPDMTVIPGKPLSDGVKKFLEREPQPVPLPEGELSMFATTPFKPECCPNAYSNSQGCACMTNSQYNWLVQRGGNNVPYSEY